MQDLQVVALHYKLTHDETVDFSGAEPFAHETDDFTVRIANLDAVFRMKGHYSDVDSARAAVEKFTRAWEIQTYLLQSRDIEFVFNHAEVIDRSPEEGKVTVLLSGLCRTRQLGVPTPKTADAVYPPAPVEFAVTPDVETMHARYRGYRRAAEPLATMAYFCLTLVEPRKQAQARKTTAARKQAAETLGIDLPILEKLGELVSTAGGSVARKAEGVAAEYSGEQCDWIDAAVRMLIRRAGEIERNPGAKCRKLTMNDLRLLP